jgi:outer membrane protein OmpA-like peptidoglycan-associated protein
VEAKNAEITRLTNQVAKLESALSESSGPVAPVPAAVHLPAERASDPARLQAQLSALMDLAQIEFRADTAELAPASRAALDRYLEVLRANTELPVEISGHTDNSGEFWHSYELSRWRARAVKEYLVGKGAVADRLLCHGCGMTRPVADNTTATGRRANNRIEFRVCMEMIAARAIARGEGRGEGIMAAGA